jgi:NADH-quinone oxidoreductase subunit G
MPKLIIDDIAVDAAEGTTVLEAAKTVGITIPHFCWHPALGKAGACRVCAVKLLDGPVKGVQMSCMLPVQEGMVVSTNDPEALAMRRQVIEWLMINHPHDCPVCDEGGECQLQDFTIAGGHGIRRYRGPKRTHVNQDLGPYVQHEMNRCIQCYRCARFYQEYAGGSDFGVLGSAGRVYFGRFGDGQFQSPFSGNLVDICPTGVFTDKTARFRARYWDYDMAPSICPGCSVGCNTTPVARYRELLKIVARHNDRVNGWFICDRGRFAPREVNAPLRPRTPMVGGRETSWDEAQDGLLRRLNEIMELYGEGSVLIAGSSRLALEGASLLPLLAGNVAGGLGYYLTGRETAVAHGAAPLLTPEHAASMEDVMNADCIALYECDLRDEGPMMLLAVRQAWRRGAPILLVGAHAPLEQARTVGIEAVQLHYMEEAPLAIFDRPVVIAGTRHGDPRVIAMLDRTGARIACLFPGPNGLAAARLSAEHGGVSLEDALVSGRVKGLVAVEADIPAELLEGIPFVAAVDWRVTPAVQRAEIVLPTTAWVEMDGTYVNFEGRAQRFCRVMQPGLPLLGLDPAGHPPRVHANSPPGSDVRPAWRVLAELIALAGGEPPTHPLSGQWKHLRHLDPEGEGMNSNKGAHDHDV